MDAVQPVEYKDITHQVSYYTYTGRVITVNESLSSAMRKVLLRAKTLIADLEESVDEELPMVQALITWLGEVPGTIGKLLLTEQKSAKLLKKVAHPADATNAIYIEMTLNVLNYSACIESQWDYVARCSLNYSVPPTIQ